MSGVMRVRVPGFLLGSIVLASLAGCPSAKDPDPTTGPDGGTTVLDDGGIAPADAGPDDELADAAPVDVDHDAGVEPAPDAEPTEPDPDAMPEPVVPLALTVCGDGSADFTTIGAALAAATPDSTVTVCPGTYHERFTLDAMPVSLIASAGAATTIIDGDGAGTVIAIRGGVSVSIRGFTIQNGNTTAAGGGLHCDASTLQLIDSVVASNVGTGGGGGLYATGCVLDITGTRFFDNATSQLGGAALISGSTGAIAQGEIVGNRARNGAGVASFEGAVTLLNNQITTNAAGLQGGGLYHDSDASITGNTIADNTAGWTGGGIFVLAHAPTISGNTVARNTSVNDGGGMYLHECAGIVRGNHVLLNTAGDDGGGIRGFQGPLTIEANLVEQNRAEDGGGGIRVSHVPTLLLDNRVLNNWAGGTGGGMDLDNDASTVRGGEIIGNRAEGSGGGIFGWLAPYDGLVIENVLISGNRAWQGGGIYLQDNFKPTTLRNLRLIGNRAGKGGALMFRSSTFSLTNSVLSGNSGSDRGGAIFAGEARVWEDMYPEPGDVDLCPCPPIDPIASISFVVITGNTSPHGAALWTNATGVTIANSIVSANTGPTFVVTGADATPDVMRPPTLRYDDLYQATYVGMDDPGTSNGNSSVDPRFVDAAAGDFRLMSDSACIDAADPALLDTDGSRADMGSFGGGS